MYVIHIIYTSLKVIWLSSPYTLQRGPAAKGLMDLSIIYYSTSSPMLESISKVNAVTTVCFYTWHLPSDHHYNYCYYVFA